MVTTIPITYWLVSVFNNAAFENGEVKYSAQGHLPNKWHTREQIQIAEFEFLVFPTTSQMSHKEERSVDMHNRSQLQISKSLINIKQLPTGWEKQAIFIFQAIWGLP